MKLLLFELKKIVLSKVYLIFLLLSILFICVLFVRNVIQQDSIQTKKIEQFSKLSSEVFNQNEGDRKSLEKGQNPETEARLAIGDSLYNQLKQLIQTIENQKWREELKNEIKAYQMAMDYQKVRGSFSANKKDMKDTIKLNKTLLDRKLPKEDLDLSIQPSIFMKKIVTLLLNVVGFMILLFLLGTQITKEFEDHTIQLVYALPVSRGYFIVAKSISLFVTSLIWLATVYAVSYILPSLFGKVAGKIFTYPLFTETGNFISTGAYLNEAVLYSLCFVAFAITVLVFLGFLLRNTIVTYLVTFLLFMGGMIVSNNGLNLVGNPFTYQNIDSAILVTPSYYPTGIAILIGSVIVMFLCTLGFNRKRGI